MGQILNSIVAIILGRREYSKCRMSSLSLGANPSMFEPPITDLNQISSQPSNLGRPSPSSSLLSSCVVCVLLLTPPQDKARVFLFATPSQGAISTIDSSTKSTVQSTELVGCLHELAGF